MKKRLYRICFTLIGTALLALSSALFILPNNILTGGVAGVAVIISPLIKVSSDIVAAVLNLLLFIIGFIFLGKEFAIRTSISSISYTPFLLLFTRVLPVVETEQLLACLYGGLLGGIGVGLVFRVGGSTGGMDVPPLIMKKYLHIDETKGIQMVDGLTVILGFIRYGLTAVLLGLISVYFTSLGVKKTLEIGESNAKEVKIISDCYEEISNDIHIKLDRGTTLLDGEGGYTKNPKKVLMCVVYDDQYYELLDIVNKHDKNAFVISSEIKDVHGEGFSYTNARL